MFSRCSASTRRLLPLALCVTISGCGVTSKIGGWFSDKEAPLQPAELVDFRDEVKLRRLWNTSLGKGQGKKYQRLVPALADQVLYVASTDGLVAAFDSGDGDRRWRTDLDLELSGGVGLGSNLVLVGSASGIVIALQRDSGQERWRRQLTSEVLAAPAGDDDLVVVQTFNGHLFGLSADDGDEIWRYETNPPVLTLRGTAAPVISDGEVYAAFANGKLVAFEGETGAQRWEARLAAPQGQSEIERIVDIDGAPLVVGGNLYAASYQGRVGAFNRISGRPVWMVDASSFERVAEGLGNIYVSEAEGKVVAHDAGSGAVVWQQDQLLRRELSPPVAFRSWVAVADLEGYVHILSQLDGRFVGRLRADSKGVRGEMTAQGDILYIYGNSGKIMALQVAPK